jgi:hypothetical protein
MEQSYCFDAAYTIYPQFLIGKLCVQHGDFPNTTCLRSKDVASAMDSIIPSMVLNGGGCITGSPLFTSPVRSKMQLLWTVPLT